MWIHKNHKALGGNTVNKNRVNDWLLEAKEALVKLNIAEDGKINKTYRGQISSFGAAIVMGSLPAAVAFFSEQGSSDVKRQKLIQAMFYCITGKIEDEKSILNFVCENNSSDLCENFIDASIALKLAMNFYDLI